MLWLVEAFELGAVFYREIRNKTNLALYADVGGNGKAPRRVVNSLSNGRRAVLGPGPSSAQARSADAATAFYVAFVLGKQ